MPYQVRTNCRHVMAELNEGWTMGKPQTISSSDRSHTTLPDPYFRGCWSEGASWVWSEREEVDAKGREGADIWPKEAYLMTEI